MKALRSGLVAAAFWCWASAASAAEISPVTAAEGGLFAVTAKATHKFTRNTAKLREQALAAATDYCAREGRTLQFVAVTEDRTQYLVGRFPSVTLTFRAIMPGEPGPAPQQNAAAAAPAPMRADELASELEKLADLRKQGLLSDAEFATLKQRLLDRF